MSSQCIEVSIFGGGVGECIVIKLKARFWMIIDSCIDPVSKKPIALKYLHEKGVDLNDVKYIMATHWHDDHIRGMADLVEECSLAKFIVSLALNQDEFYCLVMRNEKHQRILKRKTFGVKEFYKIFNLLKFHDSKGRIVWAKCDSLIERKDNIEIWTLSPSDNEITLALETIAQLWHKESENQNQRPLPARKPNHTAVVAFIKVAGLKLLFGSDLEESSTPGCGWAAVVSDSNALKKRIKLIKVPHHGSQNAHNAILWEDYLLKNGVALMTPFSRSNLPGNDDIDRIDHFVKESYCTASPNPKKVRQRNRTVQKTIRETTKSHRAYRQGMGQVKFEYDILTKRERIETYGAAGRLVDFKR